MENKKKGKKENDENKKKNSPLNLESVIRTLGELSLIRQVRPLTLEEKKEMYDCMTVNASYWYERGKMENKSLIAFEVGDMQWLHEICAEIDEHKKAASYLYGED